MKMTKEERNQLALKALGEMMVKGAGKNFKVEFDAASLLGIILMLKFAMRHANNDDPGVISARKFLDQVREKYTEPGEPLHTLIMTEDYGSEAGTA